MQEIFICIGIFILSASLHVYLHRFLEKRGQKTFKTTLVFLLGLICAVYLLFTLPERLIPFETTTMPFSALLMYILFTFVYTLFYTSPFWGEQSPSFKIFFMVQHYEKMTEKRIIEKFSDYEVIQKRLNDLIQEKYIFEKNNTFSVAKKGNQMLSLIETYRHLLNWHQGG